MGCVHLAMKTKLFIVLYIIFYSTLLLGQTQNIEIADLEKFADSLYYSQSGQYSEKDYEQELVIRNNILTKYKDITSYYFKTSLIKKYASQATFLRYDMEYDSAIATSKKAIELYKNINKQNLFFKGYLYKNLYNQYRDNREWDIVLKLTRETLKIFKDTLPGNHKVIAEVEFDIGSILSKFGDYSKVIAQYKKAIEISIASDGENNADAAYYEHYLAIVYGFIGYHKKELESYKKAINRWESIDYNDMSYLAVAYGSLSTWYLKHGDYNTAELYLIKKENLVKKHKVELKNWYNETFRGRTQVETWHNYADLYLFKKDTIKAIAYNKKVLDYLEDFNFNNRRNNPYNLPYYKNFVYLSINYALKFKANLLKKKNPEKAKKLYEEALAIINKSSVVVSGLTNRLNIVECQINLKDYNSARKILNEEIITAEKKERYYDVIQLYAKQADIAIKLRDIELMDEKYKSLFKKIQRDQLKNIPIQNLKQEDCKPYGNNEIVNIILKAAKNYEKTFIKTGNNNYLKKAHNLNVLTSNIFSENFSFLIYNDQTYNTVSIINEQLLTSALLLNDKGVLQGIIQNIERSNSRLSWKKFLNSRQRKYLNIPDSILEKENNLNAELHFYKKSLFTSKGEDINKNKLWKGKILVIERELENLERLFQKEYNSYFNQVQKRFNLNDVKNKLKKKEKIIKYLFADENVYSFLITNQETSLFKIGNKNEVIEKLIPFIRSLSKPNNLNYKEYASSLYSTLLPKSILDDTKKQDLIFILDDVLHYLPLEVLIDSNEEYLIQKHKVSYAPSLLLWNEQLKVKKSKRNKLGVFAPTYKNYMERSPKRNDSTALFGAYNEAIDIAELFNSDIYSGANASKQTFLKKAKSYSILHLAMHSTVNNIDAEFSNLSFSPDEKDNKLFISELYNMQLNADLAVLSACNTGAGALKKGEGLINVSRAFTYAGVSSTVTSLWNVPDKETSKIMVSFYTYLKGGKSKNEALQQAKLDYLKNTNDPLLKHPYYWAGFVISGNTSPITNSSNILIYILIGILLVSVVFGKKLIKLF